MRKVMLVLAIGILLQSACGSSTNTELPQTANTDTPEAEVLPATVTTISTPIPSPTMEIEPTVPPPPVIDSGAFSQRTILHDYWPEISAAAGLAESNLLGRSLTAWSYSPDGRYLAVAGCDAEAGEASPLTYVLFTCEKTMYDSVSHAYLFILDTDTEEIIATLPESGEVITVTRLVFSDDGSKLIYGLSSGKVAVWDVAGAQVQSVLAEEQPTKLTFDISPDGKWIALTGEHVTRIWDTTTEEFVAELPNGAGYKILGPPQFSSDGKRLLLSDFPILAVYATGTWEELSAQVRKPDNPDAYTISPDLSTLAICDIREEDTPRPMNIWNVATGERTQSFKENRGWNPCGHLAFSPAGNLLLRFDSSGGGPLLWDTNGWEFYNETLNQVYFVSSGDGYVKSLQFSQDGQSVMVETAKRLTLYGLPAPTTTFASLPAAADANPPLAVPLKVQSCEIKVTGALQLELHPCDPPLRAFGGENGGIDFYDSSAEIGVVIDMPASLAELLTAKTYNIGAGDDGTSGFQIVARFFDGSENTLNDPYFEPTFYSYNGGTLTFTQAGPEEDYVSGSFYFGAHRLDTGRQINVEGTFENVPFTHVK